MNYLFYRLDSQTKPSAKLGLDRRYSFEVWQPSLTCIVPEGISPKPSAAWWVMHYLRLFKNGDYGLFVIYDDKTLVHRSGIFPGYFRFPCMGKNDLQIGDTWTHPAHRGQGLASFAIQRIVAETKKPGRKFWYIVEESNLPSIRVIEKVGFTRIGSGARVKRFGLSLLGAFEIKTSTA